MSLTYTPNLPNPPDDPADDVSGMQTNAGSINTIWAVDHYSFAGPIAGAHKKIRFPSPNVPTFPLDYPSLFTNTQDGLGNNLPNLVPELFFYSGDASQSQNNYVSANQGSTFLFGGIILKWGQFTTSQTIPATFSQNFVTPFATNCLCVVLTPINTNAGNSTYKLNSFSPSSFSMTILTSTAGSGAHNFAYTYIAIGN